jgi:hypothetical protein
MGSAAGPTRARAAQVVRRSGTDHRSRWCCLLPERSKNARTMKRPKVEDMTEVEEARFRLLQARRAALRVLDRLATVAVEALSPSSREDYERVRAAAETTIAITDADWVETAQREQLIQVANHLIDPATAN